MGLQEIIWSAVSIIVTGLVSWLVAAITNWINKKIKNEKLAELLKRCTLIISDVVKAVYQDFVEALKAEGKFTPEKQKEAKDRALAMIQSQLTPELKSFIQESFGDEIAWISNQIEAILYSLKN